MKRLPGFTLSPSALGETGIIQDREQCLSPSIVQGAFRQARQLAVCQKSADVKPLLIAPPPLRQLRQLAEGVRFPEKNAGFWSWRPSFGGEGQISREKCRFWSWRPSFGGGGGPPVGRVSV